MKATSGWAYGSHCNGSDSYGFSALPGVGDYGYWWAATEYTANGAYYWFVDCNRDFLTTTNNVTDFGKADLYSVRCVKDD